MIWNSRMSYSNSVLHLFVEQPLACKNIENSWIIRRPFPFSLRSWFLACLTRIPEESHFIDKQYSCLVLCIQYICVTQIKDKRLKARIMNVKKQLKFKVELNGERTIFFEWHTKLKTDLIALPLFKFWKDSVYC